MSDLVEVFVKINGKQVWGAGKHSESTLAGGKRVVTIDNVEIDGRTAITGVRIPFASNEERVKVTLSGEQLRQFAQAEVRLIGTEKFETRIVEDEK